MSTNSKSRKEKRKFNKLIENSESEHEDEHELSYYMNDRVKLMKEVLKIIKPREIKRTAPDCIKDLDSEEINSMLLEELLGISNKRLKYIFNGQNLDEESSSTDEDKPIDIISLDDISDDDFIIDVDADPTKKKKPKIKHEKIKKEKVERKKKDGKLQEESLMSVLELLELQARARAIRSQIMIEASKRSQEVQEEIKIDEDSDVDAVIIESPKNDEIVITSSDEEGNENRNGGKKGQENTASPNGEIDKETISSEGEKEKTHTVCSGAEKENTISSDAPNDDKTSEGKEQIGGKENAGHDSSSEKDKVEKVLISSNIQEKDQNQDNVTAASSKTSLDNNASKPKEPHKDKTKKIKLIRNRFSQVSKPETSEICDDSDVILIVDQDELDTMIGD